MYKSQLKTFVCAAQAGSFSKAARTLSISTAAVLKQIDSLEKEWQVPLFRRTHSGIQLTRQGEQLFSDARSVIEYADAAISRAKGMAPEKQLLRIGVSLITSTPFLPDLLPPIRAKCPGMQFQMVPFENKPEISRLMLNNLGQEIDLVVAMCDPQKKAGHDQLPIFWEPICCAMSVYHPLAAKDHLEISDLSGQSLMIVAKNRNSLIDRMRADLEEKAPQITLSNFTYYNMDTFNACADSRNLMIAIGRWQGIHPLVRILPVNWPYKIPYGLHYSLHPSLQVLEFVRAAKTSFLQGGRSHE